MKDPTITKLVKKIKNITVQTPYDIDYLLPVRCKTDDRIYQLIVEVLM